MEIDLRTLTLLPFTRGANRWAQDCVRDLDRQIAERVALRDLLIRHIDGANEMDAGGRTHSDPTDRGVYIPRPSWRRVPQDIDLSGLAVDFDGVRNTKQRIARIAEAAPDKLLNITEVAKYFIRSGHSQATLTNARTVVQQALTDYPGSFRQVRPGTYEYLGARPDTGPGQGRDPDDPGPGENQRERPEWSSTLDVSSSLRFGGGDGPS